MSDGRNIRIEIAATGGDQAAADIRKVESAQQDLGSGSGRTNAKLEEFAASGKKVTASSVDMRFAMQNAGYQVQDMAVQISGGTSAMRAMGQQLPQLLSAFGPWGVGIGTVIALGAPLVGQLFDQAEATDNVSSAIEESRLKTIELAKAQEESKRIQEEWTQTSYQLSESIRDATTARYGFNDALRTGLELLKEEQEARRKIEEAKGRRELESADGDPVKQQEIRNRLRVDAQNREIADLEEMQRKRRELLERDSKQQIEVAERGPDLIGGIRSKAEEAGRRALEFEQAKITAEGNAKAYREFGNRPSASAKERAASEQDALVSEKSAKDWDAMAKEARALEANLNKSAEEASKAVSGTVDKLQKEMQKLADEIRKTDIQISTQKAVNAEDNAAGDMKLQAARREAERKAQEERDRKEREAKEEQRRERADAIAAAALGMDASKVAGDVSGDRAQAAIKRKAEALLRNPTAGGQAELMDLIRRLIAITEQKGDAAEVAALKQKVATLEARQKNGRDGR